MALLEENEKIAPQNCYRLVVLGSPKVGKTSIVTRFLYNKYKDSYTPTIEDFHRKIYRIRGEAHKLDILDTSGNHPFPAMKRLSLITGDLFILVYSIDSRESFEEVLRLKNQIAECKGQCGNGRKEPKTPIVVVGNKTDREHHREVDDDEVRAELNNLPNCVLLQTSAKKNVNIEHLFMTLFNLARLPTEMSPSLHRKVHPSYIGKSGGSLKGLSIRRRMSDACGSVVNARRPSIRTDLLVAQTRTGGLTKMSPDESRDTKCVIQ